MRPEAPKGRPRVGIISQGLGGIEPPNARGSIATWTYETARHLSKDYALLLIEFGEQPFGTRALLYEGISYLYIPDLANRIMNALHRRFTNLSRMFPISKNRQRRPGYASILHNLGYVVQAAWRARRWGCQIIHIHNFSQFVPVVRAFNPNARIVLHMHCAWLSQLDREMMAERVRKADAIACCSKHLQCCFLDVFPEYRSKCYVVYNGTNLTRFLPAENCADQAFSQTQRLLFVGRISPEKGVHVLIDAFALIAQEIPDVILDLVGGGGSLPSEYLIDLSRDPLIVGLERFYRMDYLAEIRRRIPESIRGRVLFHGSVEPDEVARHYRRATAFVCPSFSDAFPLTVVEAMCAGLPVVASAVGGIPEAIVHNETGLLVEPNNTEALADALRCLLNEPSRRQGMADAGRERALQRFSWSEIGKQIATVYSLTGNWPSEVSKELDRSC